MEQTFYQTLETENVNKDKYNSAYQELEKKEDDIKTALYAITAARGEHIDWQNQLKEAAEEMEAAAATASYDAAAQKYADIRAEYVRSREKLESFKWDLWQKQEAYEAALDDMETTFGPKLVGAIRRLKKAGAAYGKAVSVRDKAEGRVAKAEKLLAKAMDAKKAADQKVLENLANYSIAQADYDRLKPGADMPRQSGIRKADAEKDIEFLDDFDYIVSDDDDFDV